MNWQKFSGWLLATIPGVILLGATGSILAVFVLKIAAAGWRRSKTAVVTVARSRLKKYMRTRAEVRGLAIRFIQQRDYFGFLALVAWRLFEMTLESLLFTGSMLLLGFYLIVRGLHATTLFGVLVGLCFLTFYWWISSIVAFLAIYEEVLVQPLKKVRTVLDKVGPDAWTEFAVSEAKKKDQDTSIERSKD